MKSFINTLVNQTIPSDKKIIVFHMKIFNGEYFPNYVT